MKVFESFEKKFLFSATRAIFLVLVLLTMLAFMVGSYKFIDRYQESRVSTKVSVDSVFSAIETSNKNSPRQGAATTENQDLPEDVESGLKIPKIIKETMTGRNKEVLDAWLNSLDPEDRQNFIDEIHAVFEKAMEKEKAQGKVPSEKQGIIFGEALNKYKELKFQKIDDRNSQEAKFESNMTLYAGIFGGFIAIISLLSLVLVLLAIERNTRKPS
ncbi:hypothetical protein ICN48_05595 [Polynucleobacter sp. JS-Safj-400b-B2]|uniref:hypothetical protein n=1 Tax=Polynucleobacter sp. JS-Safj-400b-B2 TaxID=2576921 RepID=UPI001C0C0F5F|nr:hypothetical protein [Polynucleobacter sp. JS-Safj-400b-B2]MBU3625707.1 hypothetical protein [Polynucleobacter sp. JS-Safj-400b-B2]